MRISSTAVVMMMVAVVGNRHVLHVMVMMCGRVPFGMQGRQLAQIGACRNTFHRDSRERLNREAQCQQHDDEELAPI
ncbi:hypothetical protein [Paraburkholderia sp. BR14320]|uniref:hypothetical protein n=1 Tax=unclassified Paraburkholderia TaxID=2615204 RepID=UPI0034D00074